MTPLKMTHPSDEQLILHYYGEPEAAEVEAHLAGCVDCRASYNALSLTLNSVNAFTVPERTPEYGAEVWGRVAPKIAGRKRWAALLQPRWWALIPALAALLVAAFFAGRLSTPAEKNAGAVRERILLVAVGDHLDRSQMVLAELSNATDGKGKIDIGDQKQLAGELLEDNRLYRQTARSTGDSAVASVLDDLERALLDIAHSPAEVSSEQFEQLRQEIQERGLLFKVRVIESQMREKNGTKL